MKNNPANKSQASAKPKDLTSQMKVVFLDALKNKTNKEKKKGKIDQDMDSYEPPEDEL